MSKNNTPDPSDAEDYLNKLQWESKPANRRRSIPWYLIPKWKYKPIRREEPGKSNFLSGVIIGLFIITIGFLLYSSIVNRSPQAIAGLIFGLIVALVLFFAIRDAQKKSNDDNDQDINS